MPLEGIWYNELGSEMVVSSLKTASPSKRSWRFTVVHPHHRLYHRIIR